MGIFKNIFKGAKKVSKASKDFHGKNKKEISDGLRHGSSECAKRMRKWKNKK